MSRCLWPRMSAALASAFALLLFAVESAPAHPLSPALLTLQQTDDGLLQIAFKTPVRGGVPGLAPWLPDTCRATTPVARRQDGSGQVWSWQADCRGQSLIGMRVGVRGLETEGASAILRIETAAGHSSTQLLSRAAPTLVVEAAPSLPPRNDIMCHF